MLHCWSLQQVAADAVFFFWLLLFLPYADFYTSVFITKELLPYCSSTSLPVWSDSTTELKFPDMPLEANLCPPPMFEDE
jgi:hypothetical protein